MRVQVIDQTGFDCLLAGSRVLRSGAAGAKVWLRDDGVVIKLLRAKPWLSSATLRPYAARAACHAQGLRERGFRTLEVTHWYRIAGTRRHIIAYPLLPGTPLRELAAVGGLAERLPALAKLFARLHAAGVYYRSGHLGNVIELPDGELGLIDVVDVRFFVRPVDARRRARSFRILFAEAAAAAAIAEHGIDVFRRDYEQAMADPGARARARFRQDFSRYWQAVARDPRLLADHHAQARRAHDSSP